MSSLVLSWTSCDLRTAHTRHAGHQPPHPYKIAIEMIYCVEPGRGLNAPARTELRLLRLDPQESVHQLRDQRDGNLPGSAAEGPSWDTAGVKFGREGGQRRAACNASPATLCPYSRRRRSCSCSLVRVLHFTQYSSLI